ncbi:MAG: SGNH/GDSL hydrolase family protein [Gammaproteobacteria bacterium]|nr:SGNH/GDSL hydrolase family protein [Gammaproteobacteria bacterium]
MSGVKSSLFVVLLLVITTAQATPTRVIAFGDSLSDRGNLLMDSIALGPPFPPVPPPGLYLDGRFTNGPIWLEYLAGALGGQPLGDVDPSQSFGSDAALKSALLDPSTSISFAYGGSGSFDALNVTPDGNFLVPGLLRQVRDFAALLGTDAAPDDALYAVWGGANDYLFDVDLTAPPAAIAAQIGALVPQVIGNISVSIGELYAMGARKFIVPNLPVLSSVPLLGDYASLLMLSPGDVAQLQALLDQLALAHNAGLQMALDGLALLPGIEIIELDVFALSGQALATLDTSAGPAAGCLFSTGALPVGDPALCLGNTLGVDTTGRYFYDELHPTAQVHALLGQAAIAAVPVPPVTLLMLVGAALVLRNRHKRCVTAA